MKEYIPTPVQNEIVSFFSEINSDKYPGVFVLDAPTGTGKSLIYLWMASRLKERGLIDKFVYICPTRLLQKQMLDNIEDSRIFDPDKTVLLMGKCHYISPLRLKDAWELAKTEGVKLYLENGEIVDSFSTLTLLADEVQGIVQEFGKSLSESTKNYLLPMVAVREGDKKTSIWLIICMSIINLKRLKQL